LKSFISIQFLHLHNWNQNEQKISHYASDIHQMQQVSQCSVTKSTIRQLFLQAKFQ